MGSGATSPTMVATHRAVLDGIGRDPILAVLLDTTFGFQLNADDVAGQIVDYFSVSLGQSMTVAGFPSAEVDTVTFETALVRLRDADLIFADPGNATYALRQLRGTPIPGLLREKLTRGGAVTVSSAGALLMGTATLPVHEMYRLGQDPHWLEGLDILGAVGIAAAVVPHYNNTDGGTKFDTRRCYVGERRIERLESLLPKGSWILGLDEHTALTLDLGSGIGSVRGLGSVTLRATGDQRVIPSGEDIAISELRGFASGLGHNENSCRRVSTAGARDLIQKDRTGIEFSASRAAEWYQRFVGALEKDGPSSAGAIALALDSDLLIEPIVYTSEEKFRDCRSVLRSMIMRLTQIAADNATEGASTAQWVEFLSKIRTGARAEGRWDEADLIRDWLLSVGVEVQDA